MTRTAEKAKKNFKATTKRGINNVLHFASKAMWFLIGSKLLNTKTDRGSRKVCQIKEDLLCLLCFSPFLKCII